MRDKWLHAGQFLTRAEMDDRARMLAEILEWSKGHYGCCSGGEFRTRAINCTYAELKDIYRQVQEKKESKK